MVLVENLEVLVEKKPFFSISREDVLVENLEVLVEKKTSSS